MPVRYDIASQVPQISGGGAIDPLNYMAQLRQQEMANAQLEQMALRGHYQDLAAQRAAEASRLSGVREERQAEESKVKTQLEQEKLLAAKLNRTFAAIPAGDQKAFLAAARRFTKDDPEFAKWLSQQEYTDDLRARLTLTPEQQYKQTTKDVTLPSGETQTMRYLEFGKGAATPVGNLVSAPQYEPVEDKNKNIVGYRVKGTTRVISPEEAARAPSSPASDLTTNLIKQREGFQPTGKWDVNANRAGYGSDTVTLSDGSVQKVTKGMRVSQEDAERDLQRRIQTEFVPKAAAKVGEEVWSTLPENTRAALTSVAYNYGTVPSRIVPAVQSGNPETIARAIESLAGDNKGVNAGRRMQEANIARGTGMPGSRAVPAFAAGGAPSFMGGPEIMPPINMMAPLTAPVNAMAAPMAAPAPLPAAPAIELKPKRTFAIGTEKAAQQKAALETLQDIAINPDTGNDRVSDLIRRSTSGGLQTGIAGAIEYMTGEATEGMEAIAALKATLNDTVLTKLGGSLGAQISNTDREFIEQALGDIANPRVGANARLKAWGEVKRRLARYADVDLPTPAAAPSRGKAGEMTAPAEKPAERKRIKFMDLGD